LNSIFHVHNSVKTAVLRLRVTDTPMHQSTLQAKSHFAELGMSSN